VTTDPGSGAPLPNPHEPTAAQPGASGGDSNADLIQSMLSRAVEGQVSEQREMQTALGEIRGQLMRVSQELAQMRVRPADDGTDQINTVTVELREAVRFLSERLDGVTRMVAQRGEDLADIRTALTAIDAHIRSQAETIGVLSAGLQSLPSYGERVSALQENLQILQRQLSGLEQSVSSTPDDRTGEVLERLGQLADQLDATGEGETDSALLTHLQSSTAHLEQAIAGLHNRIDPIADDVTAIGSELAGLVESTADGAVLDTRISDSVTQAVQRSEQRLIQHVDDAVLALAQTLLTHRGPGPDAAESATSPSMSTASAAPGGSEPARPVMDLPEESGPADGSTPSAGGDDPPGSWWEPEIGDEAAVVAEEPTRDAVLDDDDLDAELHSELDADLAESLDRPDDERAADLAELAGFPGTNDADDDDLDAEIGDVDEPYTPGYAISDAGHATQSWTKDSAPISEPAEAAADEPAKRRWWGGRRKN
jgi:predicted  nucleic acid-binding Zn-ribbon protein